MRAALIPILFAGRRQNLVLQSQAFDSASWINGAAVTVTANNTAAPDGTLTADKLVAAAADASIGQSTAGTLPAFLVGAAYTWSVYLRADAPVAVSIFVSSPTIGVVCNVTTAWQRFANTWTADNATGFVQIGGGGTFSTGETVYGWGAQLNRGSRALRYTPTTTVAIG